MLLTESLLGTSSTAANYIEDVFSTYLYTGTGASQTITNGVDLSTKGGLVWIKSRSGSSGHFLTDSNIVAQQKYISSSSTNAAADWGSRFSVFLNNGFRLGADDSTTFTANASGTTYASWTFRKQAKFFDVVTYTGNGVARTIAHNLGSVPGCIIVKRTSAADNWYVYHRSTGNTNNLRLNSTNPVQSDATYWNSTNPTSTVFSVGGAGADTNANGATYVAYLFAHDAGGFGASGSDNVISCGSFTTDGSGNATVSLGYEPQWLLIKRTDSTSDWIMQDNMRGLGVLNSKSVNLNPNLSTQEFDSTGIFGNIFATGFNQTGLSASGTYIYIAIRRGPMKTPTSGTSVYTGAYGDNNGVAPAFDAGFPVDLGIIAKGTSGTTLNRWAPRLTQQQYLSSPLTDAEATGSAFMFDYPSGWVNATTNYTSAFSWMFRRAPGFFDVVCYTGTATSGSGGGFSHNLGVVPELIIIKNRGGAYNWKVKLVSVLGRNDMQLNSTGAAPTSSSTYWDNLTDTSTKFYTRADNYEVDAVGSTYVAYLFATVAGVSKVGSYTGSGTTKQIDCGFTGGARFVLIKRTDSTGDWYVWDSARGIVSGNDPYLLLNSTAAEVTNTDYIDTYSAGFEISSTAPAAINASGGSYIFMAVS